MQRVILMSVIIQSVIIELIMLGDVKLIAAM